MSFGNLVKELRLARGMTLRQFCLKYRHDPSNWSKMERGVNKPVQDSDTLAKWAHQLGLREGTEQWQRFMDEAAIARKRLPEDLLSDKKLLEKLPVFFRTVRGAKLSKKSLGDFIEKVRKAHTADA